MAAVERLRCRLFGRLTLKEENDRWENRSCVNPGSLGSRTYEFRTLASPAPHVRFRLQSVGGHFRLGGLTTAAGEETSRSGLLERLRPLPELRFVEGLGGPYVGPQNRQFIFRPLMKAGPACPASPPTIVQRLTPLFLKTSSRPSVRTDSLQERGEFEPPVSSN